MHNQTERLVHWLISGLQLEASLFHVGQYCGNWRASTAGRARASFHLVLRGQCYLHLDGRAPLALAERDAVFLLRDLPHLLTPTPDRDAARPAAMSALLPARADGTGLACGFFDFHGAPAELLTASFPDCLLLRADSPALRAVAPLFDLILAEAERADIAADDGTARPSPLVSRLTELLFFYLVREVASRAEVETGLWAVAAQPRFAPLVEHLLHEPGRDWSVEDMAQVANMSRASFFKHFADTCGQPPAQFLLSLRMNIAARRLRRGDSVTRAAEHVGYHSPAAFTRAFKKIMGEQPGAYQRARRSALPALHEVDA
ncbi:helix-turn-helix domain-containing protein [Azoarcus sp. TTM-91]|uniref:AraC family transcriptional regulator n=1 Tax=Azoarcus sp. TTM-91 TaxID=2691581 RepID=UPI00145D65E4|nr:AraC family transcriptional regulator [Azoarcus sp. TTM-91]NMG36060.1 helix-turn-helix domain-containing protein [Azoarcus sp. TTM-91]